MAKGGAGGGGGVATSAAANAVSSAAAVTSPSSSVSASSLPNGGGGGTTHLHHHYTSASAGNSSGNAGDDATSSDKGGEGLKAELFDRARFFGELCSRDAAQRRIAGNNLLKYVAKSARRLDASELQDFMKKLLRELSQLLSSKNKLDLFGGITAIDALIKIEAPGVNTAVNSNMFGRYLLSVFPPMGSDLELITEASRVIGAIAKRGMGPMTSKFVSMFADKALEWLEPSSVRSEAKRSSAALVLRELALAQPSLFYPYIPDVFNFIFYCLYDPKPNVRTAGANTLRTCLSLWKDRALYPKIYQRIEIGLEEKKDESIHGAFLALEAFLDLTGNYVKETHYFESACDATLKFSNTKSQLIHREILMVIPKLARAHPDVFMVYATNDRQRVHFAKRAVETLLRAISRDKDRAEGLAAFGDLAQALGQRMNSLLVLDSVFQEIRLVLARKGKSVNPRLTSAVCGCIGKLALALGPLLGPRIEGTSETETKSILDLMYETGLSEPLVEGLTSLAKGVPSLAPKIRRRTLDMLCVVLQGAPYQHPGDPSPSPAAQALQAALGKIAGSQGGVPSGISAPVTAAAANSGSSSSKKKKVRPRSSLPPSPTTPVALIPRNSYNAMDPLAYGGGALAHHNGGGGGGSTGIAGSGGGGGTGTTSVSNSLSGASFLVVLALRTLRRCDFKGYVLTKLARDCVAPYLANDSDDVREEAGLTCAALVVPCNDGGWSPPPHRIDPHVVSQVLQRLLSNAISERKSSIRKRILQALPQSVDPFLASFDVLELLFVCLHDRDHQTQLEALAVVGRLTSRNPAYVVPRLRRMLTNVVSAFVLLDTPQAEERSARLLAQIIRSAPRVVAPYVAALLDTLLPRLSSEHEGILVATLSAVGELAVFAGSHIELQLDRILNVLLNALRDQLSHRKRLTALRVLGQVVRGTGYVMTPYEEYPTLMGVIFACFTEGQTEAIRMEASRALGILGALDPHREKVSTGEAEAEARATQARIDTDDTSATLQHASANAPDEQQFVVGTEEYYLDLAVKELYSIAYSPAMYNMHDCLVHSLGTIMVKSGLKTVGYLPFIVPAFVHMIDRCNPAKRHTLFKEVSKIVDIFGPHVRPYLKEIVHCITRHWFPLNELSSKTSAAHTPLHHSVMAVLRSCVKALGREFKRHVSRLLTHVISVMAKDQTDARRPTLLVMQAIALLGVLVEDNVYSVVRAVVAVFGEYVGMPLHVRRQALATLHLLLLQVRLDDQASGVFNSLMRVIVFEPDLRKDALPVLYPVVVQLGTGYERKGHRRALVKLLDEAELSSEHTAFLNTLLREMSQRLRVSATLTAGRGGGHGSGYSNSGSWAMQRAGEQAAAVASAAHAAALTGDSGDLAGVQGGGASRPGGPGGPAASTSAAADAAVAAVANVSATANLLGGSSAHLGLFGFGEYGAAALNGGLAFPFGPEGLLSSGWGGFRDGAGGLYDDKRGGAGGSGDPPAATKYVNRAKQDVILRLAREAGGTSSFNWPDWIQQFAINLLKESRSPSLAACQHLAMRFEPFARRLFNAAFVSCWVELTKDQQIEMADGLERAMRGDQGFMQMMLNVAEFMSHHFSQVQLPMSNKVLGNMALECSAYAKALRYKEAELETHFDMRAIRNNIPILPQPATSELLQAVEDLIEITQALQQPEAAQGVLTLVRENTDLSRDSTIQPSWYEKLGEWDKALEAYDKQMKVEPSFHHLLRKMVCLDNLGKWEDLHDQVQLLWGEAQEEERAAMAGVACSAACGLGRWDAIANYLPSMRVDDPQTPFFGSILSIHREEYGRAEEMINRSRELLQPLLSTLWGESYSRGYSHVVTLQRLAEMEEVIQYKLLQGDPAAQARIREMWNMRLQGCQYNPAVWQRVLEVRSLVLSPIEDCHMWLKYASLCRKASAGGTAENYSTLGLDRSHNTLVNLLGCNPMLNRGHDLPHHNPQVTYAYIKHVWVSGHKEEAIQHLYTLIDHLGTGQQGSSGNNADLKLMARCYHKLGDWQASPHLSAAGNVLHELSDELIDSIIEAFRYATLFDRSWYKAWHSWAFMNYEAVKHYEHLGEPDRFLPHAIMSIKGFFNSIALCSENNLQDTLRLLTLLYAYGGNADVAQTVAAGLRTVSIDTWLQVIPQLIARINIPDNKVRGLLHELMLQVGRKHAQALLFPLTVAAHNEKDNNTARREAAEALLNRMRQHSNELVEQALMVAEELIRVANLWTEKWFEGIELASRLYTDRDFEGMMGILEPLHAQVNSVIKGTPTASEDQFNRQFGNDLNEAHSWLAKYRRSGSAQDLQAAWDHYYHVYRNLRKTLTACTSLELKDVSPKLLDARDLQLVVPGLYNANAGDQDQVFIETFASQLKVISSKQRPRRLEIRGSTGKTYEYLLKANEDLRQDERVMQLFGLVNVLLSSNSLTAHKHLNILTYFVLPLSPRLGLIEWVPTCDTIHSIVRDHREINRVVYNQELRYMLSMAPNIDQLTIAQKVEVFRYAISKLPGDDLAQAMWLRSSNSEQWLERRSNFTRSLAVMSMVGYVLGLGDRHPSNLMIDRKNGYIMHVDFGDCFEVAMTRDRFPECVPFRLTRMLVSALEISGVHGTFRITCEKTMAVLRENADSVMAVLEAFVHDPLIDWFTKRKQASGAPRDDTVQLSDVAAGPFGQMAANEFLHPGEMSLVTNPANQQALKVITRVKDKLTGRDFIKEAPPFDVPMQVSRLIKDATNHENLARHYTGWCAFW